MDQQRANCLLRYAIGVLRGRHIVSRRLEEEGFWWQTKILQHWIHRFQGGEF